MIILIVDCSRIEFSYKTNEDEIGFEHLVEGKYLI